MLTLAHQQHLLPSSPVAAGTVQPCGQTPEAARLLSTACGQPEGSPLSTHPALRRTPAPPYTLTYTQPPAKASGSSQAESVTVPRLPRFHGPSPLWWSVDAAFPCILWAPVSGVGFRPPKIQMLESSSPVPEDMIGIGENVFAEVKLGPSGRP